METEEIRRIGNVIQVLSKNGLGGILAKYGFSWYMPIFKRGTTELPPDLPQKLRKSMEELGGAYVKLGQLLSIRPDLIPQEYCDEFAKLQDEVPAESIETIQQVIIQEFHKPIKDYFTTIDPRPLGSASIAQVHKARLKNGKAVAIKVQRPEIAKKFYADIQIIRHIAQKIQNKIGLNIPVIINEFERYTKKELNFTIEATHIDEIRDSLKSRNITIPQVYWATTTEKILTMEYLDGVKLTEATPSQKTHIIKTVLDEFLQQIFQNGTFHADLHPGNILQLKNGKIGLLDYGIVGNIDKKTRQLGLKLYLAIIERDTREITQILLQYGTPSSKTNIQNFQQAINEQVSNWWENTPEKRRVTRLMHDLFILCTKYGILLPTDTILLGKGLVTIEATAKQLDSKFNFVEYSEKKIIELMKQEKTPRKTIEQYLKRSKTFAEAIVKLPSRAIETLDALKQGRVDLHLDDSKFRHLGKDINLSSNRLSYAMISAALILSSSMLVNTGPKIGTYSAISIISLATATLFVLFLFLSITKEGNPKYDNHEKI